MPKGIPRTKHQEHSEQPPTVPVAEYNALGAKYTELRAENELLRKMFTDAALSAYRNGSAKH